MSSISCAHDKQFLLAVQWVNSAGLSNTNVEPTPLDSNSKDSCSTTALRATETKLVESNQFNI